MIFFGHFTNKRKEMKITSSINNIFSLIVLVAATLSIDQCFCNPSSSQPLRTDNSDLLRTAVQQHPIKNEGNSPVVYYLRELEKTNGDAAAIDDLLMKLKIAKSTEMGRRLLAAYAARNGQPKFQPPMFLWG